MGRAPLSPYGAVGRLFGIGLLLALAASPAQARQSFFKDNVAKLIRKAGIHGNVSFRDPVDSDVVKGTTVGVSVGLSPGRRNGWRFPFGIGTSSLRLHTDAGQRFADLKSWSIMGGIGYGWQFGRLSTTAGAQAGVSFNDTQVKSNLRAAFGAESVMLQARNAPLLRPRLKAEYFITPKLTVRVSADYVWTTPDIAVTTEAGRVATRWNASNVHGNIGIGFYPFRK